MIIPNRQKRNTGEAPAHVPVVVAKINILAAVAARGDVIERAGEFEAEGVGHGCRLTINVLMQDLTQYCSFSE